MTIPVFPSLPGETLPAARSVIWATDVPQSVGGLTTAVGYQADEIYHWEIPYSVLRAAASYRELQQLIGFVNGLRGRMNVFYYTDPNDNAVTDEPFGTGDGSTTAFQLQRSWGGVASSIQSPNAISAVKVNGVATGAYTLLDGGIVQFTSAPAAGAALTWSGSYYFLCRLDDDKQDLSRLFLDKYEMKALKFSQVLV